MISAAAILDEISKNWDISLWQPAFGNTIVEEFHKQWRLKANMDLFRIHCEKKAEEARELRKTWHDATWKAVDQFDSRNGFSRGKDSPILSQGATHVNYNSDLTTIKDVQCYLFFQNGFGVDGMHYYAQVTFPRFEQILKRTAPCYCDYCRKWVVSKAMHGEIDLDSGLYAIWKKNYVE